MFNIPKPLKEALAEQKVVILAGAGISFYANYPSWKRLVIEMYKKISTKHNKKYDILIEQIENGELDVLEALGIIKKFDADAREVLKELFDNINPDIDLYIHKEIANISRKIITTNYDKLFETATRINAIYPNNKFELARLHQSEEYIFKVHGSIDNVAGCILFKEDYEKLYNSINITSDGFRNIISNKIILCVGFSMEDPFIGNIFESINKLYKGYKPNHYIITTDRSDFSKYNFQSIILEDYNELLPLLKTISGNEKEQKEKSNSAKRSDKEHIPKRFLRRRCRYSPIGSDEFIKILTELTTFKIGPDQIVNYNKKILNLEPDFEQKIASATYNENIGKTDEMLRILNSFKSTGQKESVRLLFLGIAYEKLDNIDKAINLYQRILAVEDDMKLIRCVQFNLHVCFEKKQIIEDLDFTRFIKSDIILLGNQRIKDKALTMQIIRCIKENIPFLYTDLLEDSLNYEISNNPIGHVKTMLSYLELKEESLTKSRLKKFINLQKNISTDSRIAILENLYNQLDKSESMAKDKIKETLSVLVSKSSTYTAKKYCLERKSNF
ncbi:SIR2 family protein (plasmid) [Capnocytophaga canis]|uniref:SIR2 family protein n=1 Tax=Capnocytophaga canis TaxID=1848903 RepID=UPI00370D2739